MNELEQEITHLEELRAKHRRNIRTLEEMLADYGMERPLALVNNLEFEREQLREVEERLTELTSQAGTEEAPADTVEPAAGPRVAQVSVSGSGAAAVAEHAVVGGAESTVVGGDVLGDVVHTVIKHAERVELRAEPVGDDPDALRRRYLAELAAEVNRLPWASLDPDYADPSRGESLGLADVYTALDTTQLERVESEDELRAFLARQAEARRVPAQEMINREAHLLLLGDPGSGKSTLVNFLSYVLAQAGWVEEPETWLERLAPWDHGPLLPLRVILREFAAGLPEGTQQGKAALLLQHLRVTLDEWGLDAFWPHLHRALGEGKQPILVLLDGLDEVPVDLRQAVVESVDGFVGRYPRHRYLVTCRPYAYVGQPWRLSGFREVTLAPFSEEQMDHFIAAWYNELARRGRFTQSEAKVRAGRLKAAASRADLRGLAERPLLLTVMALLHTFRGQLPEDRVELYRWTVDLLLRRWEGRVGDEEGILEALALPGLKMSDLEAGLYEVAFRAHQGQGEAEDTADVAEKDLRGWLAPYLGGSWDRAGRFVDYIRERAGLLVRHKPTAYTFPHRTFQEFLAACHLTGHSDFPAEAARLVWEDLDRWRVVYVLATGHAARTHRLGSALSAVNALCPAPCVPGQEVGDAAWRTAVLAGEALLEIGLVGVQREPMGQAVLKRTQDWLAALLEAGALDPCERAEAGDVLAQLGDPRPGVGLQEDGLPDFVWCKVLAGPFVMGSDKARDPQAYDNELPRHEVTLPAYSIGKYPVTNAQYAAFVQDGGYYNDDWWKEAIATGYWSPVGFKGYLDEEPRTGPATYGDVFGLPNHPVVGVSWYEAVAFCRWLTERLREAEEIGPDQEVTLPTEAQWEKAARGEDGRVFPWGNGFDVAKCNVDETGIGTTSAVGIFPAGASPYGVLDLSGNVWEWCRTKWWDSYREPADESLEGDVHRVLRGGAFNDFRGHVRCAYRYRRYPDYFGRNHGLRVVLAPGPFGL